MGRARKVGAFVLAVITLPLAGCADSGGAPHPARAASVTGSEDIGAEPVGRLRDGGTLTLSNPLWPTQLNFLQVDGSTVAASQLVSLVEPSLFLRDARGTPEPDPDYLVSAEVTRTSPQTVVYRFNPRARWSDGKPIGVRDFVAQWRALGRGDDRYHVADTAGYDRIASVGAGASAHEVKVVFRTPYADWRRLFTPLYPASAIDTPEKFNKGWVDRVPVTAGPFTVGSLDRTSETAVVRRDSHWWGREPRLSKVIVRTLTPDAALQAYRNGEIDSVNAANAEDYARLRDAKNSEIRTGSSWDEVHIALNGAHGPLADLAVRQAVQHAVNRKALAAVAGKGLPVTVPLLGNHIFMTNQPGYVDHSKPWGDYDPDAARRLLDKAGWTAHGSAGARTRNGARLRLRFVVSSGTNQLGLDLAQLLQQMLGQVGIAVDIAKVPADDYFSKYLGRGDFDLAMFRFEGLTHPSDVVAIYRKTHGDETYLNYGRVCDTTVDHLLSEASGTLDRKRATALYNEADAEIWRIGHDIELYQRPQVLAVRAGLANYGVPGLGDIDWTKVGWKK
ncbi:ABC transporter family substrate-binding protein [Streptomyces beihaiensis]|uniref:ABC transporter family substrate-binding protein n=1 Tax=Streptomyces beihaiensis TaxID=2984495 RepID=A0ABT3TNR7_9ACTN|nr:ABC transporter family substrate-binding protein [Streptomyces beihaiensis]MCX3058687.1 ABC transporter family substrate-binding protein [Streptomyces beihaiensis]